MKYTFLPKTKMGKISVGAFVTFIVTWTVFPFSLVIAGMIAVFVGFVTGVIALFRKKDRSILLFMIEEFIS